MKKRILSTLLALCMVLTLLRGTAWAAETSGTCGENLTWLYNDGILCIQGTGDMEDYFDKRPWDNFREQIHTVTIDNGVDSIGQKAFSDCTSLTSVAIPESVTSIESYAFQGCTNLACVSIPSSVYYIGSYMFQGCTSLARVDIPGGTNIMGGLVLIGGAAFQGCTSLVSVIIPKGVTSIEKFMFSGCSSLRNVTIPDSVTSIKDQAFEDCAGLTSMTIPEGVTSIGDEVFYGCSSLTKVTIPKSISFISNSAFTSCNSNLCIYCYPGSYAENYTIENAINYTLLSEDSNMIIASGSCGANLTWVQYEDGSMTISGTGPMNDYSRNYAESIGRTAPWGDDIASVVLENGVTSIGAWSFYACYNLTSVTIPESVTDIGAWAFFACSKLTDVTIPNGVTNIGEGAFDTCSSLIDMTIPSSVTSIGWFAFDGCSCLTNVIISNNVTSIGAYTFEGCDCLTSVTIPDNVTSIEGYAFNGCSSLIGVTIPSRVTSIGGSAFNRCTDLTDVYYSGSEADWKVISIGSDNDALTRATIHYNSTGPDGPGNGGLNWGESDPQWTLNVGETRTWTVTMADGSVFDASRINWTLDPALGTAEIADQGQQEGDGKTAYVTLKGIAPGKVTLTGTLAPASGEIDTNPPMVRQEITVVGQKNIGFVEGSYSATTGDILGITFRVPDPNGLTKDDVTFISSDDSVARVVGIADFFDLGELGFSYTVNIKCLKEGHATITASASDGRSANCKVIVKESNPVVDSKIVVFSTEKSLTVKTGKTMNLVFGKVVNDQPVEDWDHMAVVVSDPTVISLSEYEMDEYGYAHTTVTGKKQGATYVTISDTETKENITILITVCDAFVGSYSYGIDNMPSFYPDNIWENGIQTNIYNLNGLFVNNYACEENGRFYDVSFDVYNYMFTAGAIDIYDADGNWIDCEKISKYEMPSGIWDILEGNYSIITDFMTYEMDAASKHTPISFKVPDGGYFTISNNFAESPGVFLFNTCDIVFNAALLKTAADVDKGDVQLSVFSDLVKNQIKENPTVRKAFMEMFKGTAKSEIRAIAKSMVKNQQEATYSGISNLFENLLDSIDISWKHLFQTATGMGESLFEKLAGPAGVALKGCFALSSGTSQVMQAIQIAASVDEPYATVYSSIEEGYIAPNGVIVNTNGNVDADAELHVFRVSNDDTIEVVLDENGDGLEKYELYNICFVKDNQMVQPNGKVRVQIPIPNGMSGNTCNVYRQEPDGTWAILDAHIEGNYLVFETDHFSLYAVIGNSSELSIAALPGKTNYFTGESLDTTGLALTLGGVPVSSGFICEPTVLSEAGTQTITVRYGHTTADFSVSVKTPTVTISRVQYYADDHTTTVELEDLAGLLKNGAAVYVAAYDSGRMTKCMTGVLSSGTLTFEGKLSAGWTFFFLNPVSLAPLCKSIVLQ